MCKICESAEAVRAAARALTNAIAEDSTTELTGNVTGLRRSRRYPLDLNVPTEMQVQLTRIGNPSRQ